MATKPRLTRYDRSTFENLWDTFEYVTFNDEGQPLGIIEYTFPVIGRLTISYNEYDGTFLVYRTDPDRSWDENRLYGGRIEGFQFPCEQFHLIRLVHLLLAGQVAESIKVA